jgi:cytochrome P450
MFEDRYRLHEQYGLAFFIVSPDVIQLMVADAGAAEDIFFRRKAFIKANSMYEVLNLFGRNVNTVNGDVWQRHRRITAPPFNERNSSLVWKESRRQSDDMLKTWIAKGQEGVSRTDKDFMTLTLHVLCRAGFGKSYAFDEGVAAPAEGYTMSYRDALKAILENLLIVFTVASKKLPRWMLTANILLVQTAFAEFKRYMADMVEAERGSAKSSDQDNLMSALFRASEAEAHSSEGRNGLSDDEIFGNLFIYNLAGHDTTAMTAVYATVLFSTNTYWQSWVREEMVSVFGKERNVDENEYEKAFPQLKRCLAVMVSCITLPTRTDNAYQTKYETLRLYGPVIYTPRYTGEESQTILIHGTEYTIPADVHVTINQAALHSLPENWGSDSLVWRPDRWIVGASKGKLGEEELITPPPGTFVPWISGPRVCPGRKFAQVEFVSIMVSLFGRHSAKPALWTGETEEEAIGRVLREVEDSSLAVTLHMNNPERVNLVWEEVRQA